MGHQSLTSGMELKNNILVSGNADSTVKVWDILTGQCLATLAGKLLTKSKGCPILSHTAHSHHQVAINITLLLRVFNSTTAL
jgi:WD40 repeat protein